VTGDPGTGAAPNRAAMEVTTVPVRVQREAPVRHDAWERAVRERLVAGDHAALGEVYDQFSSLVYGLALRVIGDPRAAEDVSQDVFVWIWERPEAFDPDRGSLRTWLGTVTHRRAVDHVRREEARRRRTERDAAFARPVPDVGELAAALVTAERVRAALDVLPEEQRQAVDLAYFGGRTYREVADVLGIPEGTAKSRLRLALRKIGGVLEAEGAEL
jgi:RNA polymerase sigma-70 factor (ECF subfamily)